MNTDIKDLKVLIVDDEESVRSTLSRLLRHYKMVPSTANNAEKALKRLKNGETYDCMILDLLMPEMNGKELIQKLKEENLFPLNRVIVLTAVHHADNATAYIQYGCAGYCGKPFENKRILEQIWRACGLSVNKDELDALV
ncbi:MAG: response regulator [Planctomycetes bacterium]|nr:response regulator [Planctomycetota bacterium]